ncbi:MAG: prepilin-type N-terminal cleavage/methylation domain-containing protein, partial [Kiritimatiellaceae bacterium]|nr:prepilin-type N-terminal cleavage/methylation domain-containing protein [Kiritimatiellaceae bacterium]
MPGKNPMCGKRGFTILELLAVMAIISVLIGLGFQGYTFSRRQAKESQARADLEKLRTALDEFRVEFGRYPERTQPGLPPRLDFLTNQVEG